MEPIHVVPFTTPDGVERALRWTYGAEILASKRFGLDLSAAMDKDPGVLPAMVYLAMYDEDGQPPADLTEVRFLNSLAPDAVPELAAAWLEAKTQGKQKKTDTLPLLQAQFAKLTMGLAILKKPHSDSGQPRTKTSGSRKKSSGGASPAPK